MRLRAALFVLGAACLPSAIRAEAPTPVPAVALDSTSRAAVVAAAEGAGLEAPAIRAALAAYRRAVANGAAKRAILTVIDYSLPSHVKRLWVLDLARARVLAREFVAHGRGSGADVADRFSNRENSYASSLGAFVTGQTYDGKNGLSLRLEGLDAGVNDRALDRGIVVHGAWYVSQDMIRRFGRLGRSEGCPALSTVEAPRIIHLIEGGSVLYAYHS